MLPGVRRFRARKCSDLITSERLLDSTDRVWAGSRVVRLQGPAVQLARERLVRPAAQDKGFIEGDGRHPIGPGGDGEGERTVL